MIYRFADCTLDVARQALCRAGEAVHVEPQVFDLLQLLAEAGETMVTRDRIVERVWAGRIVSEATISARISAARRAVGDDGRRQAVIRTISRRGLQMAVPVVVEGAVALAPQMPQPDQEIRFARSADGTGIAWAASGAGPPLLRAGHWLSHLELDWQSPVWRPLLDRFGQSHRLYRYDPRGTGLSQRGDPALSLDHFVADLKAVADAAGLERFAIYGVSQSVPVAVAFAARYPERVSAMVLHAGFALGPELRDAAAGSHVAETFVELIRNGWGQSGSAFMTAFSTLFMPGGSRAQVEDFAAMQRASASPEMAVKLRHAIGQIDASDQLAKVRCPVLVAHGREDAVHPFSEGRRLATEIADARFLPLETSNHVALPDDPAWERLMSAVESFLAAPQPARAERAGA